MSLRSLLTASVSIRSPAAGTKDAYGGFAATTTDVTYPASVQVDSSREALDYERQTKKRTFAVYLETSAVLVGPLRVAVLDGPYTGVLIDVLAPKADHAGRGTYWMLRGTEVA